MLTGSTYRRRRSLRRLSFLLAIAIPTLMVALPAPTALATAPTAGADHALVTSLRGQVDTLAKRIKEVKGERSDAEFFFNAVTIIIGAAAALITIVAILTTVAGYKVVRTYIDSEFTAQAESTYEKYGKPTIEASLRTAGSRLDQMLAGADERLAEQLEVFRKAGTP